MLGRSKAGTQNPAIDAMQADTGSVDELQQTPADLSTIRAKKEVGEPFSAVSICKHAMGKRYIIR